MGTAWLHCYGSGSDSARVKVVEVKDLAGRVSDLGNLGNQSVGGEHP